MSRVEQPWLNAWRAFVHANESATCRIETALAEAGLPPLPWYDVLWALRRQTPHALRMGELSENVLTMSRTGLTRLVDRMAVAELVRREVCESDRRGTWIVLTDSGRRMHARMWAVYAAEIERIFAGVVGAAEAEAFAAVLERIVDASREPSVADEAA